MKSKYIYILLAIATVALSTYSCKKPEDNVTTSASQVEKKMVSLPCQLSKVLTPIKEFDSVKDCYDSMELTDSLKDRIRIFVDKEPNFILYEIQKFTTQLDDENIDFQCLLGNEYIFTSSDKDALYNYLCANTCLYNCIGSRYRVNVLQQYRPSNCKRLLRR